MVEPSVGVVLSRGRGTKVSMDSNKEGFFAELTGLVTGPGSVKAPSGVGPMTQAH